MRAVLLTLSLLPFTAAQEQDAEKLYRVMEKKLASLEAFQTALETSVEGLPEAGHFKATFTLAKGNRIRIEGEIKIQGKTAPWNEVSNGVKYRDRELARPTPPKLYENFLASFRHGGVVAGIFLSASDGKEERWPTFHASGFKSGKQEKLGGRTAQVISYTLTGPEKKAPAFSETLWLDVESHLPLKRVFTGQFDGKKFTFTETYGPFNLAPKITAETFLLPKR
jgi:outer membrane lipoprotein-sorting protein